MDGVYVHFGNSENSKTFLEMQQQQADAQDRLVQVLERIADVLEWFKGREEARSRFGPR